VSWKENLGVSVAATVLGGLLLAVILRPDGASDEAGRQRTSTTRSAETTIATVPTSTAAPLATAAASTTGVPNTTLPARISSLPYAANWSSGRNGWFGPADWKVLDGALVNDGSGQYSRFEPIIAPPVLEGTPNYAAEAVIRVTRAQGSSFGLVVRADGKGGGYAGGVGSGWRSTSGISDLQGWWGTNDLSMRLVEGLVFDPGSEWHTYRLEARGNVLRLLVDGSILAEVTDNTYLSGGRVGLWCNEYQVEVRSFEVVAI
jgi:hypothetical protein